MTFDDSIDDHDFTKLTTNTRSSSAFALILLSILARTCACRRREFNPAVPATARNSNAFSTAEDGLNQIILLHIMLCFCGAFVSLRSDD